MNWHSIEAQKGRVLPWVLGAVAVLLVMTSTQGYLNPDSYWHLRIGLDWVEHGLSPWRDHYSFTFADSPVRNPPVLFDVFYYGLVKTFGEYGGALALRLTAFLLMLALLLLWMRRLNASLLAYLLVLPSFLLAVQFRSLVRPELFSYALMLCALLIYHRTELQLTWRAMLPVLLLMLFWTNFHSPILGYVIFCGLFVDIAARLLRERAPLGPWVRWAGWGVAIVLVGFMNRSLSHPLLAMLAFSDDWKYLISEYEPLRDYRSFWPFSALLVILFAAIGLAVRQRRIGYLLILFVFINAASSMARMITPLAVVALPLFAEMLSRAQEGSRFANRNRIWKTMVAMVCAVLIVVPLPKAVRAAYAFATDADLSPVVYPEAIAEYLRDQNLRGPIFNQFEVGGFLLYRLAPENTVYIDGRAGILYPPEHMHRYLDAMEKGHVLKQELDRWGVPLAIVQGNTTNVRNFMALGYELEHLDVTYHLFRQGEGRLGTLGRVWAYPACWDSEVEAGIQSVLPGLSTLERNRTAVSGLLSQVERYLEAGDRADFLREMNLGELASDAERRFFFYRAAEQGFHERAIEASMALRAKELGDLLGLATVHLLQGDQEKAVSLLNASVHAASRGVGRAELLAQIALLSAVQQDTGLDESLNNYRVGMAELIGLSLDTPNSEVGISLLCPDARLMSAGQ